MKRIVPIAIALAAVLGAGAYSLMHSEKYSVEIPAYEARGELVLLDQGWSSGERVRFHHTAQGTRLIPYEWLTALEQPYWSLSASPPFADGAYLSRFGFLEGSRDQNLNPDILPIGFTRQTNFFDPETRQTYAVTGLTCAACHTGELRYGKYSVRVEGGPARVDLARFQKALGLAMGFTELLPFRYGRFEAKVLGTNATDLQKSALKKRFTEFFAAIKRDKTTVEERHIYDNQAGYGRTDALTRIGNQAFAFDMKNDANLVQSNAPVRFPQIWDAPWFNWVQYNSSISDPLVRNIGEAVGVRAVAKLYGPDAAKYESSVFMPGLREIEDLIAGPGPFEGLRSPKWPTVFPPLDAAKVSAGAALYRERCQGCHLPPPADLIEELKSKEPTHWIKNEHGKPFLRMRDVQVTYVGTDPRQALDFLNRTADTGSLNFGTVSAAVGLEKVTRGIATQFFAKASLTPQQQIEWSGYRDPGGIAVRAEAIYKPRPLNGIWAVAPFLHNGSIPNLYLLLSPQGERPDEFWTGSKRFDPERVGFAYTEFPGGYKFDITKTGNSNAGHEFKDGPRGNGIIGPALSPEQRWALIEYLKSL